jgi:hypothetical protein
VSALLAGLHFIELTLPRKGVWQEGDWQAKEMKQHQALEVFAFVERSLDSPEGAGGRLCVKTFCP